MSSEISLSNESAAVNQMQLTPDQEQPLVNLPPVCSRAAGKNSVTGNSIRPLYPCRSRDEHPEKEASLDEKIDLHERLYGGSSWTELSTQNL